MSSPDPIVSEAIIAPGPKMVSHDAGFRDVNESNGGRHELTVLFLRNVHPVYLHISQQR